MITKKLVWLGSFLFLNELFIRMTASSKSLLNSVITQEHYFGVFDLRFQHLYSYIMILFMFFFLYLCKKNLFGSKINLFLSISESNKTMQSILFNACSKSVIALYILINYIYWLSGKIEKKYTVSSIWCVLTMIHAIFWRDY